LGQVVAEALPEQV